MGNVRSIPVGYFETTRSMHDLVRRVLDTGRISYGPLCEELEGEFALLHDCDYAVLSASGTDSLRATLHARKIIEGWEDGAEVIVPATTFVATINIVDQINLKPVLVDVEEDHFCIDPESALAAINDKTVAIIPVNLLGQPANLQAIDWIAYDNDIDVIEDSCEAMFVTHRGAPVGSWGIAAAFSFYVAHLITAGVGGVTTTNDEQTATLVRSLINHGRDPIYTSIDDDDNVDEKTLRDIIKRRYSFMYPGYSSRMTELQAALALPQLHDWEDMLARRQAVASKLAAGLSRHSERLQLPSEREAGEHAFMMYGLRMRDGEDKWPLMLWLEQRGIETREMLPIVNQKMYSKMVYESMTRGEKLLVSRDLIDTAFYIGCHQGMSDSDADYVCEVVDDFFRGNNNA